MSNTSLQCVECRLLFTGPGPVNIACKCGQGFSNVPETTNKASIEIYEAEKRLNFLFTGGCWPIKNPLDFDGVHANPSFRDDESEVFNFSLLEVAFFRFQKKLVLT
ncbi:hypothetical protein PAXINDRAFT_85320 [Paxillus involutus ATCC 200175]|uniref:Uncharacterized protein n=1 Tax=Paxillus involutus ATCC 200175 TaxID=664439 RepID=A0A0C9TUJ3_PAXIN|nr:hypothetical protein PAXINDRAFT_85320 [Paxillus involutus ATCC 200175]